MSSTILHISSPSSLSESAGVEAKNPFLVSLGERVRAARARRGMTRKSLALAAEVSERHLANLEGGTGNASILVLLQVANALECSIAEFTGDVSASSPEWLMIRAMLADKDDATLRRVRESLPGLVAGLVGESAVSERAGRIALIGLRGAGKSTLGKMLADERACPFIELSAEIEKLAGCTASEIQALYGMNAYRRYERRALESVIAAHERCVIATPGGIVSDASTFNLMLSRCTTVWLQAKPEDHMKRVVAQGDMRPMAASREAMQDLKGILDSRAAFYGKADFKLDTSAGTLAQAARSLAQLVKA
jgi:XRE family transcriptional regulator, aerobic/anaerobic benzoate catabolism transcriptional regulator